MLSDLATENADRPLAEPTQAEPGSPEKVAELARRLEAGQELWHPLDARLRYVSLHWVLRIEAVKDRTDPQLNRRLTSH